jgi:hypothetical protein
MFPFMGHSEPVKTVKLEVKDEDLIDPTFCHKCGCTYSKPCVEHPEANEKKK